MTHLCRDEAMPRLYVKTKMSEKFKNKYTIKSARLAGYDYSREGIYFVTICAKDREHFFGEIENGKMELSEIGKITDEFWQKIPKHFPFVKLDEYVIMPNHVHGIVEICDGMYIRADIDGNDCRDAINRVSTGEINRVSTGEINRVSTGEINRVSTGGITGKYNPMNNPRSLSKIIRWYKGRCSFEINNKFPSNFQWQPRFYDHIIRNEKSLWKIREYIRTNPKMWERDRNNLI